MLKQEAMAKNSQGKTNSEDYQKLQAKHDQLQIEFDSEKKHYNMLDHKFDEYKSKMEAEEIKFKE